MLMFLFLHCLVSVRSEDNSLDTLPNGGKREVLTLFEDDILQPGLLSSSFNERKSPTSSNTKVKDREASIKRGRRVLLRRTKHVTSNRGHRVEDFVNVDCSTQREEFKAKIEQLENRTALHIEYAEEKQIEIQYLENNIEIMKNNSFQEKETIKMLSDDIGNLTQVVNKKDVAIDKLENDIERREQKFSKLIELGKLEDLKLNDKFTSLSSELVKIKEELIKSENLYASKILELSELQSENEDFKSERNNLLKIIKNLAQIGNPSLHFITEIAYDNESSSEDYRVDKDERSIDNIVNTQNSSQ